MSSFNFPDDVELVRLEIKNLSGNRKSIGPQIISMRVQEDVTSSYVFIEVDIMDGIGLLQTFPIVGEEIFDMEIRFPKINKSLKYKFGIFAVTNVALNSKNNVNTYTLQGVSEEALHNASSLVVKGYNDKYENIVKDILKNNLKSTKPLVVGATRGVHNIVLPNAKPFAAIDMIRKRSTAAKYEYSPMLFFETSEGFIFKDMVDLFKDGKQQSLKDITYIYNNVGVTGSGTVGTIVSFGTQEKHDSFQKLNTGAFNNQVSSFDLITKKLQPYEFKYSTKKGSFEMFNQKNAHSNRFIEKYGSQPARSYVVCVDSSKPDAFVDRFGDRQAYTSIIFQNFARAELNGIPGSKVLKAGGVVYLSFETETVGYIKDQEKNDKGNSGYYFIKRLIHEIHLAGGIPMYRASVDLISGVMMEKVV